MPRGTHKVHLFAWGVHLKKDWEPLEYITTWSGIAFEARKTNSHFSSSLFDGAIAKDAFCWILSCASWGSNRENWLRSKLSINLRRDRRRFNAGQWKPDSTLAVVNAIRRLVEVGGEDDRPRTVRRSDVWLVGRSWSFVRNRCRFLRRVQRLIYDNQWTLISCDRLLAASLLNVNLIEHSTVVVGDGGSEQSKAEAFVGQTTEFMADPAQIEYINPFTSSDCMHANGSRAGAGKNLTTPLFRG